MGIDFVEPKLCSLPAISRYTWPGGLEKRICVVHAIQLGVLSDAMGLNLKFTQLTLDEIVVDSQCHQRAQEE